MRRLLQLRREEDLEKAFCYGLWGFDPSQSFLGRDIFSFIYEKVVCSGNL